MLTLIVACASPFPEDMVKPVIRSIAIVPATEPLRVTLESRSIVGLFIPVVGLVAASEAKQKQARIAAALLVDKLSLAEKLTQQVVADPQLAGYQVEVPSNLNRPKDYPDSIDILTVNHTADAILQSQLSDVGVSRGFFPGPLRSVSPPMRRWLRKAASARCLTRRSTTGPMPEGQGLGGRGGPEVRLHEPGRDHQQSRRAQDRVCGRLGRGRQAHGGADRGQTALNKRR
ncbi:MAG: hypothetical protein LH480_13060 [Rubrivivax sp.]|nr:hypothetical protein [Rubrivivax sp.]